MKKFVLAVLIAVIVTVVLTWPFAIKLASFYTDYGDYPLNGSIIWYNYDSIVTGKILQQKAYFDGYQAFPHPYSLAYSNLSFVPGIIFTPIYILTQNYPLAMNIFAFLTFVLTFIAAFYCIDYLFKQMGTGRDLSLQNRLGSIIGALVFTFNPQTLSRFPEHLDLMNKYFLPPLFLFAYLFLNRPSWKRAFFFGLFFTLNGLSVNYYLILSTTVLLFLWIPFFIFHIWKKNVNYFLNLAKSGLVLLFFVPILWYFLSPYLEFSKKEGAVRTIEQSIYFSSTFLDWFSSSPNNALYGGLVKSYENIRNPKDPAQPFNNYQEHSLFLNIVPMLLFGIFIYILFKNARNILSDFVGSSFPASARLAANIARSARLREPLPFRHLTKKLNVSSLSIIWFFGLLLIITFILSFGPYFLGWNNLSSKIPLPYLFLHKLLPFMQGLRAPTRFQFIFYIPFSLFVALGVSALLKKFKRYRWIIFITVITIIIAENYNHKNFDSRSYILPKVARLKSNNNLSILSGKSVLHYPIYMPDSFGSESTYLNWATQTKEHIVNSNSGYIPPDQLQFMAQIRNRLDETALKKLTALGTDFVLIHTDLLNGLQKDMVQRYQRLYQWGVILDRDNIVVLDVKKYGFRLSSCSFPVDFDINPGLAFVTGMNMQTLVISIKSTKDCYLASRFDDRYRNLDLYVNGQRKTAHIRMPMLIEPNEEIVLSEVNKEIRL